MRVIGALDIVAMKNPECGAAAALLWYYVDKCCPSASCCNSVQPINCESHIHPPELRCVGADMTA
jgi:hypothetical protein